MLENLGRILCLRLVHGVFVIALFPGLLMADGHLETGPQTEKRFPPLQLPKGFHATLFACDPLVEYPSVIALGPEAGTLFVAHDYMTGLGVEIVRRDEVRLIRDTDGDGYADTSTVFAEGFNSIQGLAWTAGTVFVMHAPFLTAIKDRDGDGVADERRDLLSGLGLPPEKNSNRLHCANGVSLGHDGWLYLALGDRGCDVKRPEGDRLLLQEGGILRCRPDGRDLHVFSRGLRNIYDVALDEEQNVFVRDNENDGGDYMIRVCHAFHGSDHGYPYLYYERPGEAMPPLVDLGRGSSAGGTAYLETRFPPEFRESVFFCEWGRAVVRYHKRRSGSSFAAMEEIDFAAGAPNDPYGFKPTDLVVDRDGSLLISDWCDGQRPKRGRGRIYRITYSNQPEITSDPKKFIKGASLEKLFEQLGSESYSLRTTAQQEIEKQGTAGVQAVRQALRAGKINPDGRLHAVWILSHLSGAEAVEDLFQLAENDPKARVRAQCVRALADLTDPVLTRHRLDAGRGEEEICRRLARIGEKADPRVRLEVLVALGRLSWSDAAGWLRQNWTGTDPVIEHAAMMLLRRSANWPAVLELLDEPSEEAKISLRTIAIRALADHADETIVDGLLERLKREGIPQRRREYLDLLTRIYKKPDEWTYWGFRPGPRPANSVVWSRTEKIAEVLDQALRADPDSKVKAFTARSMLREQVPLRGDTLTDWLKRETDPDAVAAILEVLGGRSPAQTRGPLESIIRSKSHASKNRLSALDLYTRRLDSAGEGRLLNLVGSVEEGEVLAAVLRELGKRESIDARAVLMNRLDSQSDEVRAAAIDALVRRPSEKIAPRVTELLKDRDLRVRRAAARLAGRLNVHTSTGQLLAAAEHSNGPLRAAALESLATLREPAAIPLALKASGDPETQIAALACLSALGGPEHLPTVAGIAERNRSIEVLLATVRTLKNWQEKARSSSEEWREIERTVSKIHSISGVLFAWRVREGVAPETAQRLIGAVFDPTASNSDLPFDWRQRFVEGTDTHVALSSSETSALHLAVSDLFASEAKPVEFLASADGTFRVWLNGKRIFERKTNAAYQPDSDRFDATLAAGKNRLLIQMSANRPQPRFQLHFRRKSSIQEHERLTRLTLEGRGNVARGREVFLNREKSLCMKCHRLGDEGSRIGPDLNGIGSRFSRIHLVESILQPSRTVAPSYETLAIALKSGQVVTGVKLSETDNELTLGDSQGNSHKITRNDIEALKSQPKSTMPDGLEKQLTDREFVDLISFLVSLKNPPAH